MNTRNFFHNWYFIVVLAGEFALQFFVTQLTPVVTRTFAMDHEEWGACLMLGSTPLLISALLKCTPKAWVDKFKVKMLDETKAVDDSKLLQTFNKVAATSVGGGGGKDDDDYKADPVAAEELAAAKQNL